MKHVPPADSALAALAVLLMLGGVVMIFTDAVHPGISIPLIAVGIALTAIVSRKRGRQHIPSH